MLGYLTIRLKKKDILSTDILKMLPLTFVMSHFVKIPTNLTLILLGGVA